VSALVREGVRPRPPARTRPRPRRERPAVSSWGWTRRRWRRPARQRDRVDQLERTRRRAANTVAQPRATNPRPMVTRRLTPAAPVNGSEPRGALPTLAG